MPAAPLIVEQARSASAIAVLLHARLAAAGFDADDPLREALVHIGARYGEILTEHLNAAPSLHLDAFLTCIGGQPTPAVPATVALSFTPVVAAPATAPIVVPGFTPLAAAPSGGDGDAVGFETERDLTVVRAAPVGAWAVEPQSMAWADVGAAVQPAGLASEQLFAAAVPIERALHIAAPRLLGLPNLSRVRVEVAVQQAGRWPPTALFEWGIASDAGFERLRIESDSTQQFSRTGVVELIAPAQWPAQVIGGVESLWLSCRVLASAQDSTAGVSPCIAAPRVGVRVQGEGELPAAVCWGSLALDASKDYFPFGERPRFGNVFHVMAPALAVPGARITFELKLTNPAGASGGPLPAVDVKGEPLVKWEAFTRRGWVVLEARDGTLAFTQHGDVSFTLPTDVEPFVLAGQRGAWIRARMMSGHYGSPQLIDGLLFPAAPSIQSLLLRSAVDIAPERPARLLRAGVLELASVDVATPSFEPFAKPDVEGAALFIAIDSHESLLAGRVLCFHVEPGKPVHRPVWRDGAAASPHHTPRWQLRSAEGWCDCSVTDESNAFTRPGIVAVTLAAEPADWPGSSVLPDRRVCWLRVVWPAAAPAPRLRRLVFNAVRARQTLRLRNELLGSSTGRPDQTLSALRKPVVGSVVLQVRDAALPSEPWVQWQEASDFTVSGPRSDHFCLDRRSGQFRFGNGVQGRIPPAGANNIRLHEYHVGGGRRGNVAAGTVVQLRTTVPYIQAVTNPEPAAGGQDAGDAAAVHHAASGWLRHRDRAVCADDYVDLCRAASPEVARAWCVGNRDLDAARSTLAPGVVSVVILPQGDDARPQPSPDLLRQVKAFLDARRPLNAKLVLLGPEYASVSVAMRVAGLPGASAHEATASCRQRLVEYLHPVTGGDQRQGWAPGERPHRSDLVALIGAVDGVDHVVDLRMSTDESGLGEGGRALALVCAGTIEVSA